MSLLADTPADAVNSAHGETAADGIEPDEDVDVAFPSQGSSSVLKSDTLEDVEEGTSNQSSSVASRGQKRKGPPSSVDDDETSNDDDVDSEGGRDGVIDVPWHEKERRGVERESRSVFEPTDGNKLKTITDMDANFREGVSEWCNALAQIFFSTGGLLIMLIHAADTESFSFHQGSDGERNTKRERLTRK